MATDLRTLMEIGLEVSLGGVEPDSLVDSVPQTPWDLSLFNLLRQGVIRAGRYQPARPCRLQGSRSALRSHPCVALSSAGAKDVFPVSVSIRVHRAGNGKRQFELIASGVTNDFPLGGELGQGRANVGGANATKLLQLLNGARFL